MILSHQGGEGGAERRMGMFAYTVTLWRRRFFRPHPPLSLCDISPMNGGENQSPRSSGERAGRGR